MTNATNQAQQGKPSQLTQLERLKALQGKRQSNMTRFENIGVIHVGVEPKPYYPKLKDKDGKPIKGPDGQDQRSETSTGWTYTFVEYGTAKQVKVVLPNNYPLEDLSPYVVSGEGYDIKQGNLIFIQENGKLATLK